MDKNKIVMIAPVAVTAILMLGILAAAGNAQESSNTSSSQESSKTRNGVTSPTSSQESSKTGNGVTSPTSSQETSNGKKPTELTISATPNGPAKTVENEIQVPVKFSGRLTSEGSGVAGVVVTITENEKEQYHLTNAETDSSGHYSIVHDLPDHKKTYTIQAWAYAANIPEGYEESHATTTIQLPENAVSSTNQAFAAKRTELTLSATPTGPAKTTENNETNETHTEVPVTISGRLTSEGSGVAGATIFIGSGEEEINTTDTDSGGHYSIATEFSDHNSEHTIHAFTYKIPSDYEKSNATTTFKVP